MTVPLGVGAKVGRNWNEPEEDYVEPVVNGIQEAGYESIVDGLEVKADQHKIRA